ncbi:subunit B of cofactor assembly of complex C [Chloropicon primus]|uniref:Subunit B of cofactor assembly of complex C n=2 Tax=Chloropicon primus TaxID=1764295 RepID=A0A5B8MQ27_9CHLO|nr:subunit B of cofactor assembly of complex C [Chloropicon primus]UPR00616.1 subunit B of cofactor assembly of complex C [Chloropicon primus]|eukprot:QDZ21402.1 subunit B of cofactor assembly of complex C [Chloropicon primus]
MRGCATSASTSGARSGSLLRVGSDDGRRHGSGFSRRGSSPSRRTPVWFRRKGSATVRVDATDDDADIDISVFQFTLGIPGIPDEQVPRILGTFTCFLLALNHFTAGYVDGAQVRSEVVALILGATCIALPTLNSAISFNNSSILSQAERTVGNTKELFYLCQDRGEDTMKELAWVSFALLKNTNSAFVLYAEDGKVMLARGSFKIPGLPTGIPVTENYPMDRVLCTSFEMTGGFAVLQKLAGEGTVCLENRFAIDRYGLYKDLCFVAKGIESVVVSRAGENGVLIAGANAAKAFSTKQQKWIANVAKKLSSS